MNTNVSMTANEIINQTHKNWEQGLIAIGDYQRVLNTLETCHNLKRKADEMHAEAEKLMDEAMALKNELITDYNL